MWKRIENSNYEISDTGQVRNITKNTIVKSFLNERGYECIALPLYEKGKKNRCKIHRLVAKAFLPNYVDDLVVHHKNGIRHDNRLENLEYLSREENGELRYYKSITYIRGKETIQEIINMHSQGKTVDEIFFSLRLH